MPKYKVCVYKNVGRADIHLEAKDPTEARTIALKEVEDGQHPFYGTDQELIAMVFAEGEKLPPKPE